MLNGLTRPTFRPSAPFNPGIHSPAGFHNRLIIEKHSPDGSMERREHVGNIATTYGLNNLGALLATGTQAFSATNGWVRAMAVGTSTTAAVSTDTTLGASTASQHISGASMDVSHAGGRSLNYLGTFADANAYTINEVGVFGTNDASGSAVARSVLATSDAVVKGTGDTVNVTYQFIFTTA